MTRKKVVGIHRSAVETMIAALATRPEDAALVESCRSLAGVLDSGIGFDDRVWREYRFALRALLERASGGTSDDFDAEFDALRAEVGDSAQS